MPKARSVSDVILGEAASGTPQQRYEDMKAIASAIVNRARQVRLTPEQIVSNPKEFNAYGRKMPAGVQAYRSLADKAMNDVLTNGPTHKGTFYATPSAVDNLPKGLLQETKTAGHVYYSDPQNRAIGTSLGYRSPQAQPETAQQAISGLISTEAQPATPSERMGLLSAYSEPVQQQPQMANMSVPTRSVKTTSYRQEPQVSLDTLQPSPQMGLLASASAMQPTAAANASVNLGMANSPEGLLAQDVATQRMIDQLNAQKAQLAAGINPMDTAAPWKQQPVAPVQTPEVQQVQAPAMAAYQPDPQTTQAVNSGGGLLSPQEEQAFNAQRAYLSSLPANSAAKQKVGNLGKNLLGGLGGGLLGAAMLGPVGGLLGGLLGKSMMTGRINTMMTGYPQAPSAAGSRGQTGGISRDQLNEQGRNAYGSSGQFRDAVDKGSVGLW